MKRLFLTTILLGTMLLGATAGTGRAETYEIGILDFEFILAELSIAPGDSVHWTNEGDFDHTVTSGVDCTPDGAFDSGALATDGDFGIRFDEPGTYPYFCTFHCGVMTGVLEVGDTPTDEATWGQIKQLYR